MMVAEVKNAKNDQDRQAFVYIIREQRGPLKIGMSKDPRKRCAGLQGSHSRPLELAHFVECGNAAEVERRVKEMLKPWHVRGEWFRVSEELAAIAIEAACANCERRSAFLARMVDLDNTRRSIADELAVGEQIEREFPDLWAQRKPPPPLSPLEIAIQEIAVKKKWCKPVPRRSSSM